MAALLAIGLAASASRAHGQTPPRVQTEFAGVGVTGLSSSNGGDAGLSLFAGFAISKIYFNVATNIFNSNGTSSATNDYQLGWLVLHSTDPNLPNRVGFGVTGGYWAAEGGGSPLVALNGFVAPIKWKVTNHLMVGYIFPKNGGEAVFIYRYGLGWVF
jgi:hypothetical protein